jgi:hypothetical protein
MIEGAGQTGTPLGVRGLGVLQVCWGFNPHAMGVWKNVWSKADGTSEFGLQFGPVTYSFIHVFRGRI